MPRKYIPRSFRRLSRNIIFTSKTEIKHKNNKAIITVYTYNREKSVLLFKINKIRKSFYYKLLKIIDKTSNMENNSGIFKFYEIALAKLIDSTSNTESSKILLQEKLISFFYKKKIKLHLKKEILFLRKFKVKLNFNKYKFEEKFIYILNSIISNLFLKKIEFNIINMRSLILNSDVFTRILTLGLRKNTSTLSKINFILNKTILPLKRTIDKRSNIRTIRNINLNSIQNKYKNVTLNFILKNKNSLSTLLKELYYNIYLNTEKENELLVDNKKQEPEFSSSSLDGIKDKFVIKNNSKSTNIKINEMIFNSISYKNISGVRLEVKGRLTKRYRADRSQFKVK
jgi:hypothetical protein